MLVKHYIPYLCDFYCVKENKIIENREQPGRAVLYFLLYSFLFKVILGQQQISVG